jgi:hypothetical protein
MAFLDNSGDIILDAVLTDTGRMALARGDGSFKIVSFALADDEIDYGLYSKNHPSGSAYYDLDILQTPILEAITNNATSLKSKLVSYSNPNLLYMPILKLNTIADGKNTKLSADANVTNMYVIVVDQTTMNKIGTVNNQPGILNGVNPARRASYVRLDQGLDTTELPKDRRLSPDLLETQYTIEIDNRLGFPMSVAGNQRPNLRFIDDDNIATYLLSSTRDRGGSLASTGGFVTDVQGQTREEILTDAVDTESVLGGPPGSSVRFKLGTTLDLQSDSNNFLFKRIGGTSSFTDKDAATFSVRHIDTLIRVTALTTGYSIDVPVRFIKYDSSL